MRPAAIVAEFIQLSPIPRWNSDFARPIALLTVSFDNCARSTYAKETFRQVAEINSGLGPKSRGRRIRRIEVRPFESFSSDTLFSLKISDLINSISRS